jgi:hypothetical protein
MNRTEEIQCKEGGAPGVLVGNWLSHQMSSESTVDPKYGGEILRQLPQQSAWERLTLLREVLDERPALDRAVCRLSIDHQFRLTLELLRGTVSPNRQQEEVAAAASYLPLTGKAHHAVFPRERTDRCVARSRSHGRGRR